MIDQQRRQLADHLRNNKPLLAANTVHNIGDMYFLWSLERVGVIYDVDPVFANTEEWWLAIPEELRPHKDQPFYHLFAENAETEYVAYVSEQNLVPDTSGDPVRHPQVEETFERDDDGVYRMKAPRRH